MKQLTNVGIYRDFSTDRGSGKIPSVWVSKCVFDGMMSAKFTGSFKVRNYSHNGQEGARTSTVLDAKIKTFPAVIAIRMSGAKIGERVKANVLLLDCGMIDDANIGVTLGGVVSENKSNPYADLFGNVIK